MKIVKVILLLVMLASFMTACGPTATPETVTVIETVIVEGTPVVVTKEVPVEVEKVITATPEETSKYGGTFTWGVER